MADRVCPQHENSYLRRLRSGDEVAFAEFVRQYEQIVFLCCRTLGLDEAAAEDVAGETFLAAYRKLPGYRGQSRLSTWLWKIAYYKSISYLRKNGRYKHLHNEAIGNLITTKQPSAEAKLETTEQAEAIWLAVEKLPRLWAMAIILFYREEKSIKEIAKIMKSGDNTVKTYLFRGRKRLKKLLPGYSGDY